VDSAYRYGGDEFVVILPNTPAKRSTIVANRIISLFQNGFNEKLKTIMSREAENISLEDLTFDDNKSKKVGLSIGISEYRQGKPFNELIKEADAAMYKAKRNTGIPICIYEES
jgi:GGDEF domain-containing protein